MPNDINPKSKNKDNQAANSSPDWSELDKIKAAAEKSKAKLAKPVPKAKPLVEGINSPKSTSDIVFVSPALTEKEKKLIAETKVLGEEATDFQLKPEQKNQEPRLLPNSVMERVNKKSIPGKGLLTVIIIVILIIVGYEAYGWYFNKPATPVESSNQSSLKSSTDSSGSMPAALAGNSSKNSNAATSTQASATSTPAIASSTPNPGTLTPTPPPQTKLKINSTPTGFLNFRSGPSLSYSVITKVRPGEVYTYTASQSGWYKIVLANGTSGWVSGKYVTVQ